MRGMSNVGKLLVPCLLLACDAKTEPAAKTEPTKAAVTKPEPTKAEPTKTEPAKTEPAKTEPAKIEPTKTEPAKTEPTAPPAEAIAPPLPIDRLLEVHAYTDKLVSEIPLDDAALAPKGLAKLGKKHRETDGITKKVAAKAPGIPDGFHEGDSWVVLTPKGAELVKVTGLGFPAGDGAPLAYLVLRDEPTEGAFGLAWPGTELPAGATMSLAPATESLELSKEATFERVLAWLTESSETKPILVYQSPTPNDLRSLAGRYAHGHQELVVISMPELPAGNDQPNLKGAWTLGVPNGMATPVESVFQSKLPTPLVLRALIDWNGDGTQDALVFDETYSDDGTTVTTLVYWQDGMPRTRVIVPYYENS